MNIRTTVLTFAAAAIILNCAAVAAAQDAHEVRVGTAVNITTCVMPSLDEDDEFILTNIVDVPAHPPYAGKVVYWVSDWKKLRDFVGKRVQFDATIKDVDRKEIELKRSALNVNGNGNGNGTGNIAFAEIELNGNQVKAAPETVGLSSAQTVSLEDDDDEIAIPTTLVKLKLRNTPTLASGSCDSAAMRAAAIDVETRTDTVVTETAVTETARIETPVAEVAVETPRAEVEVAAAAETPVLADVAEAEVEIETPTAAVTEETRETSMTTRTALPVTATPLPLLLLVGLGSLTGAGALRLRRK